MLLCDCRRVRSERREQIKKAVLAASGDDCSQPSVRRTGEDSCCVSQFSLFTILSHTPHSYSTLFRLPRNFVQLQIIPECVINRSPPKEDHVLLIRRACEFVCSALFSLDPCARSLFHVLLHRRSSRFHFFSLSLCVRKSGLLSADNFLFADTNSPNDCSKADQQLLHR